MTIDEAIKEAKISAILYEKEAHKCAQHGGSVYEEKAKAFKESAEEFEQVVDWLEELKAYREAYPYGVGGQMKEADDTPQITMCRDCDDYAGDGMYCASNFLVRDFSTSAENCKTERSRR